MEILAATLMSLGRTVAVTAFPRAGLARVPPAYGGIEFADVAEGERPQKESQRRRSLGSREQFPESTLPEHGQLGRGRQDFPKWNGLVAIA